MSEVYPAIRLSGLRLDSLGNYLEALGLLQACSQKWPGVTGLWSHRVYVVGAPKLSIEGLSEFLLHEWRPSMYERWWKGNKEISALRSWEPSLTRVRLLDAHIVAKGSNVYNDILGTGGNVGKRDFSKVFEVCRELVKEPEAEAWLQYALFGASFVPCTLVKLPRLPSTGTWFANANKAFNSGFDSSKEGTLSPWSYLLALEGAILLRGGTGRRLGARAQRYATFPFVSESAAPETRGEINSERSEFWAPVWERPATIVDLRMLLRRGQARVGMRAARAPSDFAVAALASGVQAGLSGFERFSLRQTTSANTYEAIWSGSAKVTSENPAAKALITIANWTDSLPWDKATTQQPVFYGLRGPVEKAMIRLAQKPEPERWRELLLELGRTQRGVDQNRKWREFAGVITRLPAELFRESWPTIPPEVELARAIASVQMNGYGLRHNIFGITREDQRRKERFADPRPASVVWHDGDPVRLLADVLERRLIDAEPLPGSFSGILAPPLRWRQPCSSIVLDHFAAGRIDVGAVTALLPALSLIQWPHPQADETSTRKPGASAEFLLQGYFRPLVMPRKLQLRNEANEIQPDATRARALVRMIRGGMWQQAIALAECAYRSCGIDVVTPPYRITVSGDHIAACLLVPLETSVTRAAFRRWIIDDKKG